MSNLKTAASLLRLIVPAGKATPSPPVGPALGQRGVKSMDFCKQFNDRTKNTTPLTPTPVIINIKPDRTFTFVVKPPPTSYLLLRAAGVTKGATNPGQETVGTISLKHIYEIAKIKKNDPSMVSVDLYKICKSIIGSARSVGVKVVH
ncbi:mitochondrial 54S ribosomal protein YmL19 [Dimargaris cristalligena]|uniref:Large ribosomal subunit protein uL11m n=1 Tax=Dimargaris cristalligena TaxID=215637 RepID=A0A4Q0A369_9FUNG|nr:mitochondrial 54S ribosomal protein YmL19 [Dimargaris cristalligena]RKP39852.1 50S ribosomal protein L11 [Dimargaris cristalligena]|eukprot:RKP39852.1 50S ribosomal protein L11 [Dimargaris cristalligena]